MSVFARNSTQISNREASPQLLNDPGTAGGVMKQLVALVTSVASDSATSLYRFFQLPSNAVITSLKLWAAAQGTGAKFDLGVWDTPANGGATISTSLFESALDVSSAVTARECRFTTLATSTAQKQLWDLAGLSSDPSKVMDIAINVNVAVASGAGGSVVLICNYAQ